MHILLHSFPNDQIVVRIDEIKRVQKGFDWFSMVYLTDGNYAVKETVMEIWNAIQHEKSK